MLRPGMARRMVRRRAIVRTAAVGGLAYAAGHHAASKSAKQQYMDEQQDAQIADLQQQQQSMQQAPPVEYQQPVQPVYQEPAAAPALPAGLTDDDISQLKRLGELHESGVLTDAEFETAKRNILRI
ncbi:MAG: SHOCT domain-containing protein [Ktedonobacteraceae bacterium]